MENNQSNNTENDPGQKARTKTFRAVKKTCSALKQEFSAGTDRLADAWMEDDSGEKKQKTEKLKKETMAMVKNITSDAKKNLEGLDFKTVFCDMSYELGRFSRTVLDGGKELVKDIKDLKNGK
ncbi:MAG: hypothetical protein HQL24_02640 [Candidatus Omnitrophica bacterium]|nr:hypothetical protein [Candidatus Omnitrophota bacterium]